MPERARSEFQRASWLRCAKLSRRQETRGAARWSRMASARSADLQQGVWAPASFRHSTPAFYLSASDAASLRFLFLSSDEVGHSLFEGSLASLKWLPVHHR